MGVFDSQKLSGPELGRRLRLLLRRYADIAQALDLALGPEHGIRIKDAFDVSNFSDGQLDKFYREYKKENGIVDPPPVPTQQAAAPRVIVGTSQPTSSSNDLWLARQGQEQAAKMNRDDPTAADHIPTRATTTITKEIKAASPAAAAELRKPKRNSGARSVEASAAKAATASQAAVATSSAKSAGARGPQPASDREVEGGHRRSADIIPAVLAEADENIVDHYLAMDSTEGSAKSNAKSEVRTSTVDALDEDEGATGGPDTAPTAVGKPAATEVATVGKEPKSRGGPPAKSAPGPKKEVDAEQADHRRKSRAIVRETHAAKSAAAAAHSNQKLSPQQRWKMLGKSAETASSIKSGSSTSSPTRKSGVGGVGVRGDRAKSRSSASAVSSTGTSALDVRSSGADQSGTTSLVEPRSDPAAKDKRRASTLPRRSLGQTETKFWLYLQSALERAARATENAAAMQHIASSLQLGYSVLDPEDTAHEDFSSFRPTQQGPFLYLFDTKVDTSEWRLLPGVLDATDVAKLRPFLSDYLTTVEVTAVPRHERDSKMRRATDGDEHSFQIFRTHSSHLKAPALTVLQPGKLFYLSQSCWLKEDGLTRDFIAGVRIYFETQAPTPEGTAQGRPFVQIRPYRLSLKVWRPDQQVCTTEDLLDLIFRRMAKSA
ncbi:unnamed protein product [Amoebophrya sp. A120]|nr:unnamed protein product [Amoebophrya sp. A120]|eukprot:GSA120T00002589001.1